MNRITTSIMLMIFLFFSTSEAKHWRTVAIPGASCGSGMPYLVYIDQQAKDKLLVEFMGGGACWSASTCYGKNLKAIMFTIPKLPHFSLLSSDSETNPLRNHSMLYMPYCTGDVHAGHHKARYKGLMARHVGYTNVQKTFAYLKKRGLIDFDAVNEVVLWGASAGAIGAITHTATVDAYVKPGTKKLLLADSPGLHFGRDFWKKFTPQLFKDYQESFSIAGLNITNDDGNVAAGLDTLFEKLQDWKVAMMQSTRDKVMSLSFGDISQADHEKLVLSSQGLEAIGAKYENVSTWVPRSGQHTYLIRAEDSQTQDLRPESAYWFFRRMYKEFKLEM